MQRKFIGLRLCRSWSNGSTSGMDFACVARESDTPGLAELFPGGRNELSFATGASPMWRNLAAVVSSEHSDVAARVCSQPDN